MVEQPLPAGDDDALARHAAPGAALRRREPATTAPSLAALAGRYDVVNIKLDKAGGLTEALALRDAARAARLRRSWSAAWWRPRSPWRRRCCVAQGAEVVDLDGPLLLARDRAPGLAYDDLHPSAAPRASGDIGPHRLPERRFRCKKRRKVSIFNHSSCSPTACRD